MRGHRGLLASPGLWFAVALSASAAFGVEKWRRNTARSATRAERARMGALVTCLLGDDGHGFLVDLGAAVLLGGLVAPLAQREVRRVAQPGVIDLAGEPYGEAVGLGGDERDLKDLRVGRAQAHRARQLFCKQWHAAGALQHLQALRRSGNTILAIGTIPGLSDALDDAKRFCP